MPLPGPNQTQTSARRMAPSERIAILRQTPARSISQAFAAGWEMDPAARQLGRYDAIAGIFRLSADDLLGRGREIDALAYLAGWIEGDIARKKGG
jgi:hypothetical protein